MDRRRLWKYKGRSLQQYRNLYNWLFNENEKVKKERLSLKKAYECVENARRLAATVMLEWETRETVKPLVSTKMVPCNSCEKCEGKLECYTLEVAKQ